MNSHASFLHPQAPLSGISPLLPSLYLLRLFLCCLCLTAFGVAIAEEGEEGGAGGDGTTLAELPHWPIGLRALAHFRELQPPNPKRPITNADLLVWIPPGAERIRGIFLIPNNSDSKNVAEHPAVREACARHELAVVYLRRYPLHNFRDEAGAPLPKTVDLVMQQLATETGIGEFVYAPWITFGKSSLGDFPIHLAWRFPERTIAGISYHAASPHWPPATWHRLAGQNILWLVAQGEIEWGGTWYNHSRPGLLNYRVQHGWLPTLAVAHRVGHGNYYDGHGTAFWGQPIREGYFSVRSTWDFIASFIDAAADLRLPDGYPSEGPLPLRQVDEDSGYVVDPFAIETLFNIPRQPLRRRDGSYLLNPGQDDQVSGFRSMTPPADFSVPEDVPVVPLDTADTGLRDWLLIVGHDRTRPQDPDPMTDLDPAYLTLQPRPGDTLRFGQQELPFTRLDPSKVPAEGGFPGVRNRRMVAYTVLEVSEPTIARLALPFTASTRQQAVLAGIPLQHRAVVELAPGRYPLLVLTSQDGPVWGRLGPWFETIGEDLIARARARQAEFEAIAAEAARLAAAGANNDTPIIQAASGVPPEERLHRLWLPSRATAEAWVTMHSVEGSPEVTIPGLEQP